MQTNIGGILMLALIIFIILSILTSKWFWIIAAFLFIYSVIRRFLLQRQMDEFNAQRRKKEEEMKATNQARSNYEQNTGDVIDVEFTEHD